MAFVELMYKVPCRQTMTKRLQSQYAKVKGSARRNTRQDYKDYLNNEHMVQPNK